MIQTLFLSVVPSPYQRDLFKALAARPELTTKVCYMEGKCSGYPWPVEPLESWEEVLPGRRIDQHQFRVHWNTRLPQFKQSDVVILNAYLTSVTAQWAMRRAVVGQKWIFWGERLRPQQSRWRRTIQSMLAAPLQRAAGIAAIGSLAATDYQNRFPKCHTFNIPYHCNLAEFLRTPLRSRSGPEVIFLFCGVMNRRKGVDLLIRAFDRLVRSGAAVQLHLVGQEAELPTFLQDINSQTRNRIHFKGFHPPAKLPEFFSQADLFVLPSRHDGWGVVVNQALGAGLPIICSDAVGAGHDLIDPEVNGLRFASENEAELLACLRRFVDDPQLCSTWGHASRKKAREWSPEVGAAKWVNVLQKVKDTG